MTDIIELAIIGAGPAGMEAAITAARAGVDVCLVDSAPSPGGQYYKQVPGALQVKGQENSSFQDHAGARQLFKQLAALHIRVLRSTLVWGIFEGSLPDTWCLKLYGPGAPASLLARKVIIAAGAYDRSVPFPGWDLPGVITAGAALTMIKHQGVLPGKRVLLTGTGPLQLAAAAILVQAGAEVVGVCESAVHLTRRMLPYLPAAWGQWGRMAEGLGYIKTLAAAGVPYHLGTAVISARGEERVSQACMARLDGEGKPLPGSQVDVDVDTLVVGYNLLPSTEIFRLLECEMQFDAGRGGFIPKRDEFMETSLTGIYAVGDCAGIGGARMAAIEGRIAGWAAAGRLSHLSAQSASQFIAGEMPSLRRERRFAQMLGDLFSPPPGLYALASDETILCRCEQVTLAQVREAVKSGSQSVADVKNLVRTGMGNCQGRTCGSLVAHALARETGRKLEAVGYFNMRPPVHPLPLAVLEEAGLEVQQPAGGEVQP